jgi:alkylation response protein AidB-like acyl-CoA dehydrogenase
MTALSPIEQTWVSTCERFAQEVMAPRVAHWDHANAFPADVHAEAHRVGISYAGLPRELGGRGISHLGLVHGGLAMAAVCAPMTFTLAFDQGALRPVLIAGTADQRRRWVSELISRRGHAAWCMTEPEQSGTNLLNTRTRATRTETGWELRGEKCMVGMGTVAEVFFVLADAWDGPTRLGPTVFAVPREAGVEVGENPEKIGFRCLPTPDVRFVGARVGNDAVIGRTGGALPVLLDSLDYMRLGGGVVILGLVRGTLADLGPWLDQREVYGGRLGDTSHVQITLGRLLARQRAAEALLWEAAAGLDQRRSVSATLSALKLLAADLALDTTQTAAQLLGWRGVLHDHPITRRLRDARQTSVYEGTSEAQALNLYRRWAASRTEGVER